MPARELPDSIYLLKPGIDSSYDVNYDQNAAFARYACFQFAIWHIHNFREIKMKKIAVILLALILTGCAGGQAFLRPQGETLSLGKTTYDEIIKSNGEPRRTGTVTRNNSSVKTITYAHAVAVPFSTSLQARTVVYSFYEGVLVGYDYASSFTEDKSEKELSDEVVKQISRGDERSRVISLLGKPDGEFIFPLVDKKGSSALRYTFLSTYRVPFVPTPRISTKVLTVDLDSTGIVTNITSTESQPN